eukprot:1065092-Rhodomonas_salina.3
MENESDSRGDDTLGKPGLETIRYVSTGDGAASAQGVGIHDLDWRGQRMAQKGHCCRWPAVRASRVIHQVSMGQHKARSSADSRAHLTVIREEHWEHRTRHQNRTSHSGRRDRYHESKGKLA